MTEAAYQGKLLKAARAAGWLAWKLEAPGTAGVPDTLLLAPRAKAVFIEVKKAGKEPSDLQEHWLTQLRREGFVAFWIDTSDDIEAVLKYASAQLHKRSR
jgi:hypothetical protein